MGGAKTTSYDLRNLLDKPSLVDDVAVDTLYDDLSKSNKPVFLIGDEASEAVGSILSFSFFLKTYM